MNIILYWQNMAVLDVLFIIYKNVMWFTIQSSCLANASCQVLFNE